MATEERSTAAPIHPNGIEKLKPRDVDYEVAIVGAPGLRLRVTKIAKDGQGGGAKVFRWYVTAAVPRRVVTLGRWTKKSKAAFLTPAEAQAELERLKDAHAAGKLDEAIRDLHERLHPAPIPTPVPGSPTLTDVADEFYKRRIAPHRKRPEEARTNIKRDILRVLGDRPVASITTADCAALIGGVVDGAGWREGRGAKAGAGKVLALLKQLLRFAEGRDYIQRNPAARLDPDDLGIVAGRRKRWLTDEEIPLLWNALGTDTTKATVERHDPRTGKTQVFTQAVPTLADTTRAGLKLLLLTGARSGELLLARWEQVDLEAPKVQAPGAAPWKPTWTIPVANQKLTKKQARDAHDFVIPLPPLAVALFAELKAAAKDSPWVMASPDPESKLGHYDDKTLGHAMRRLFAGKSPTLTLPGGPASPHDLRRTMRTHLGKLRVAPHITERCLNHSLGRIVQTYDRGDYLDERREALDKWAGYVLGLTGEGAKVVAIPAVRS